MGMEFKLQGRLAEAFVRVERDLAILYGAGYFNPDEWVMLDGIIHKGDYLFTDGPEKPFTASNSPTLDSVKESYDPSGNDIEDLLDLDEYDASSSLNFTAVEQSPEFSNDSLEKGDENLTAVICFQKENHTQPLTEIEPESTTVESPIPRNPAEEVLEPPKQAHNPSNSQYIHYMHPMLAKWAPELSRPWTDGEKVPNIRMVNNKAQRSKPIPSVTLLRMEKGDLIEVQEFIRGNNFWAKNLRTGEEGQIHESFFFPDPWPEVAKILEKYRAEFKRRDAETPLKYPPKDNNQFFTQKKEKRTDQTSRPSSKMQRGDNRATMTCWFWKNRRCTNADDECKYAHYDTGKLALNPQDKWLSKKRQESVAGNEESGAKEEDVVW